VKAVWIVCIKVSYPVGKLVKKGRFIHKLLKRTES